MAGRADSMRSFDENKYQIAIDRIQKTAEYLQRLHQVSATPVVWLGPFREYRHRPLDAVYNLKYLSVHPNSEKIFAHVEEEIAKILNSRHDRYGIEYIPFKSVTDLPTHTVQGDCYFYRDTDHFTRCAEKLMAPAFKDFFAKAGWAILPKRDGVNSIAD